MADAPTRRPERLSGAGFWGGHTDLQLLESHGLFGHYFLLSWAAPGSLALWVSMDLSPQRFFLEAS